MGDMKVVQNKKSILDILTNAILKSRRDACFIALIFSLIPYFASFSVVTVALVTLRKGLKDGAYVAMVVMLPILAIASYHNELLLGLEQCFASVGIGWLLAAALFNTRSWSFVLSLTVAISVLVASVVTLFLPDFIELSKKILIDTLSQFQKQGLFEYDGAVFDSNIRWFAEYLLGVHIAITAFMVLTNLAFARYMQSRVFNPGGFVKEFLSIKVNKSNLLFFAMVMLGLYENIEFMKSIIIISSLPLVFAGISLVHWRVRRWATGQLLILLPCYFLLIAFMPFSFAPLIMIGGIDVWYNFRNFQS